MAAQTDLEIREYTKRDLRTLLADQGFWMQSRLPITKRRAASHIANSRAADDDLVLLTAYDNGRLAAYLGILPDLLLKGDSELKFAWLTTWWVDKASSHRLAATRLLFRAMKRYSNRIAVSSFSDDAKRVYDATGQFQQFAKFNQTYFIMALPPSFGLLSRVTKWGARAKNVIIRKGRLESHGLEIRPVGQFPDELSCFIDEWAAGDPLGRDSDYWKWVLDFPWVSSSEEDKGTAQRYEFSVFAKDFKQTPLVVTRHGKIIAFLLMTYSRDRLTLKHACYFPGTIEDIASALRVAIRDINPWLFVSADTSMSAALSRGFPFQVATRNKALEAYSTKVFILPSEAVVQLGVGDNVFT